MREPLTVATDLLHPVEIVVGIVRNEIEADLHVIGRMQLSLLPFSAILTTFQSAAPC
jgi:hypothetical protein